MNEVAEEYGIHLEKDTFTIKDVQSPFGYYWENKCISDGTFDIVIDVYDEEQNVGYEYITPEEQNEYRTESVNELNSIESLTGDEDMDHILRSSGIGYSPFEMEKSINPKKKDGILKFLILLIPFQLIN